jgi:subtilisin family serine protease
MPMLPALVAALALGASPAAEVPSIDDRWAPQADQWLVQLDAAPLARYEGGVRSLAATAPEKTGRKVDTASAAARAYDRYVDERQAQALQAASGVKVDVEYRVAFSGFAARLSDDEAAALRKAPGVRRVTRERFLEVTQERAAAGALGGSEPNLLGLPGGLWKRLGGPARAGRGVIVGIVDSGITPEAPSFSDRGLDPPASWDGSCQGGEEFPVTSCSDKLIGARYFADGIGEGNLPDGVFVSPRDEAGHGTHVAAIAAGNSVDPKVGGDDLGVGRISGVAPAAHLAAYKACWAYGVCSDVDVVAAIDRAVADGVDVINMSLGGPVFEKVDPMQLAALNADAAGVVVVTSAGNSGELTAFNDFFPAIGTPAAAPWTTAVAATTGQRTFRSTVRATGAGATVEAAAAMLGPGLPRAELVDARAIAEPVPEPRVPIAEGRNCVPGAFEPGQLQGKIVLCDYPGPFLILGSPGIIAQSVKEAGGVGVVLSWQFRDLPLWNWPLPVAVVKPEDARALRELLAAGRTTVSSTPGHAVATEPDRIARFSSRGPVGFFDFETSTATFTELLRPDVAAPGVDTLSAYAPTTYLGHFGVEGSRSFDSLSGTSMASPMAAGAAALLSQLHPQWSPATIRSALTMSAKPDVVDTVGGPAGPDDTGGGRIDPTSAADADLAVEPTTDEYARYAEGLDPGVIPGDLDPIAARDLNVPSLALPKVTAPVEIARTFTNIGPTRATWTTSGSSSPDGDAFVGSNPSRFTLGPGQRKTVRFQVVITRATAGLRGLAITARNQSTGRVTRVPIAARNPGIVDPPGLIRIPDAAAEGERDVEVTVSRTVSAEAHGLARADVKRDLTLEPDGDSYALWMPLKIAEDRRAVLLQGGAALSGVALYRDGDGNGKRSQEDEYLPPSVPGLEPGEYARLDVPAGDYLVGAFSRDTPVRFDLRTWLVDEPAPDDPELVAAGDPLDSAPAWEAERTLKLRWSGAEDPEPLRGVVLWHAGPTPSEGERLGASVVEVAGSR